MSETFQPESNGTLEKIPLDSVDWSDGEYQVMPPLPDDEYNSLKSKIEEEGFDKAHPIIIDEDGTVNDGHHRCQICDELGITEVWVYCRGSMDHEEKIKSAYRENTARRNLGSGEKRQAAKEFYLNHYNGESLRDIADMVGVSRGTVSNAKNDLVEVEPDVYEEPSKLDTSDKEDEVEDKQESSNSGSNETSRPSNLDTPEVSEIEAGDIPQVQLSEFRNGLEALEGLMQAVRSTGSDEITEQARNEFGEWLLQQQEAHPDFFNYDSD